MNKEIVLKFVEAINEQNLPSIIKMMAEDFVFIDTHGNVENKEQMKTGWQVFCDSKKTGLNEVNLQAVYCSLCL